LVAMAFESLGARRVEIRCDDNNAASRRVAERNAFTLEGILRNDSLTPAGEIRSTCVYARLAGD
jgi:ribosomal-protein-serine acetyltransferase